jgi:predicted RNA-binding protein YlxR (DUF448 family)
VSPNDKSAGHQVRRCASCRTRREASDLVRLVADETGSVRIDLGRRMSGRGLNLCPSPDCFHDALRKNLIRRSLGVTKGFALSAIREVVLETAHAALFDILRDARRTDGVEQVDHGQESPPAYRAYRNLLAGKAEHLPRRALPSLSVRHPGLAARVGRLSDLLNRFTIEQPGAKTRRLDPAQPAGNQTTAVSRAPGEL